ncbi:ADP-ribosylation factor-like protein 9 [Limanda limanda]|uniref:ADP-ribosylation factor-like protein 9 n=1 Tax=Limanda limanda TaxID=27771 RepID=UPI0029C8AF4F|nr:ADP-ribosylation factor-like protein 9 [Limanda limanda]
MVGWREAGALGASAAVAGGVAFLIWKYTSFPGQETPEARGGGGGGGGGGQEGEDRKEVDGERSRRRKEEEEVMKVTEHVSAAAAPPPVAAVKPPETPQPRPKGTQVLVLGLDGAGKTSLLHCLSTGSLEQDMQPTQGFNAVSINREDLHIEFLEIGGKEDLRPYWQKYMSKALLLVFVVDSSQPEHFPVAREHLHALLTSDPCLPLMVLANKQDLPGACSITDLHDALSLSEIGERKLFLIGTHVRRGEAELSSGVQDARDLIVQMVSESR